MRPSALLIVASCLLVAAAQPPTTQKDGQSSFEPNSRPGAGQKYLEKMVGNWDVSKVFYPRDGALANAGSVPPDDDPGWQVPAIPVYLRV